MNHTTTIGVEYKQKIIKLEDNSSIRVQIWDTAGTTRYNTITPNYYRNVDGILLVFDILLVGNKKDLEDKREVQKDEASKVADQIGIVYVETSAKTFESTRCAFDELVAKILKRKKKLETTIEGFTLQQKAVNNKKTE